MHQLRGLGLIWNKYVILEARSWRGVDMWGLLLNVGKGEIYY